MDDVSGEKSRTTRSPYFYDGTSERLSESIVHSATKVFRARADTKRREFVDVAQSQVAAGATMLSDEIGKRLENVIDRFPGGINVRPLIESFGPGCAGCYP